MDMDAIPVAGMDRLELLQVADAVAREKSIERDEVVMAGVWWSVGLLTA